MKILACLTYLLCCLFSVSIAQTESGEFNFNNGFNEKDGDLPALQVLGQKGVFKTERLEGLGISKTVYVFDQNCGLSLDVSDLPKDGDYSIEIYFKFNDLNSWRRVIDWKNRKTDNGAYIFSGQLNFYNLIKSDIAPVEAGKYSHYVLSKNSKTKEVNIYANGIGKISFIDATDETVVDEDRKLNFFHDDMQVQNEASSGAVAYIKFYSKAVEATEAKQLFENLAQRIPGKALGEEPNIVKIEKPEVLAFNGKILSKENKKPIKTTFRLIDKADESSFIQNKSDSRGAFVVYKNPKTDFKVEINAEGYFPFVGEISHKSKSKTFYLDPIKIGEIATLENVLFHRGSDSLHRESFTELDKIAQLLATHPNLEIELSGHTDNNGDAEANLILSEERVLKVEEYLIGKGINSSRIWGRGYGENKPKYDNNDPQKQGLNRRVEFKIIQKD